VAYNPFSWVNEAADYDEVDSACGRTERKGMMTSSPLFLFFFLYSVTKVLLLNANAVT
jgi:hypothetical protein